MRRATSPRALMTSFASLSSSALSQPPRPRLCAHLAATAVAALLAIASSASAQTYNVVPTVTSVVYILDANSLTASMGYVSSESSTVNLPYGSTNFFLPGPMFRGQPTSFVPGSHDAAFSVTFAASSFAEWNLSGRTARADMSNVTDAVVRANYTPSSSLSLPNLSIQNGATLTLSSTTLAASGGVFLESGTRLRLAGGVLDAPKIDTTGTPATVEFAHTATAANPFYVSRNGASSGGSLLLTGGLQLLHTSGYTLLPGTNTFTGGTELAGGTLALGAAGALGSSGTISFSGGTLAFTAANTTDYSARFSSAANQAYNLDTNGQEVLLAFALNSTGGSLTKSGAGTLRLAGNNAYTGGTTLHAGTLALESNTALGTGTVTLLGGTLRASLAPRTLANPLVFAGDFALGRLLTLTGPITVNAATTISAGNPDGLADNTTTLSGALTLNHGLTFVDGTGWGSGGLVLSGAISGHGALHHATSGTLTLSGSNSFSGGITLDRGTLALGSDTALGTGTLTINGGTLVTTGASRTLANSVSLSGDLTLDGSHALTFTGNWNLSRTRELTIASSTPTTISGVISGVGRSLNKFGAGELVLTGANTYTGGTYIGAGTVRINNLTGSAFGTGAVTVDPAATLTGAGSFSGALQNHGAYLPGNSPSLVTLSSFSQGPTGTLVLELGGLTRGTHYDALNIAGAAAFDGTLTVTLINSFNPTSGASFNLFDWSSVTGTFATLNLPALASGLSWNTSTLYTDGTLGVSASAIPEPSTYAALLGAATLALAASRRRPRRPSTR